MDHNSSSGSDMTTSSNDAEGVWSADIDQAFHEALRIYPPCGRRKIILSDEGKMYGRNELIARYIKLRCGKTRTRKQVSSHIQVLARKRQREAGHGKTKAEDGGLADTETPNTLLPHSSSTSPNQHLSALNTSLSPSMVAPTSFDTKPMLIRGFHPLHMNMKTEPFVDSTGNLLSSYNLSNAVFGNGLNINLSGSDENQQCMAALASAFAFQGLSNFTSPNGSSQQLQLSFPGAINQRVGITDLIVSSQRIVLCGFVAYIESNDGETPVRYELINIPKVFDEPFERIKIDDIGIGQKYPHELLHFFQKGPSDAFFLCKCWVDISFEVPDVHKVLYAVDSYYNFILVSTKVCSFGEQTVEKIEVYSPSKNEEEQINGLTFHTFKLEKSPMCEYVVAFINKLKELKEREMMNSVLDNFTVLQTVTEKNSGDTLMVICFAFEVSPDEENSCRIYRLVE